MAHLCHHCRTTRSQGTARVLRHRLPRRRLDISVDRQPTHAHLDPRTSDLWIHVPRPNVQEGANRGDGLGDRTVYEPFAEEEDPAEVALGRA